MNSGQTTHGLNNHTVHDSIIYLDLTTFMRHPFPTMEIIEESVVPSGLYAPDLNGIDILSSMHFAWMYKASH